MHAWSGCCRAIADSALAMHSGGTAAVLQPRERAARQAARQIPYLQQLCCLRRVRQHMPATAGWQHGGVSLVAARRSQPWIPATGAATYTMQFYLTGGTMDASSRQL